MWKLKLFYRQRMIGICIVKLHFYHSSIFIYVLCINFSMLVETYVWEIKTDCVSFRFTSRFLLRGIKHPYIIFCAYSYIMRNLLHCDTKKYDLTYVVITCHILYINLHVMCNSVSYVNENEGIWTWATP